MILLTILYFAAVVLIGIGWLTWPSLWSVLSFQFGALILVGLVWAVLP